MMSSFQTSGRFRQLQVSLAKRRSAPVNTSSLRRPVRGCYVAKALLLAYDIGMPRRVLYMYAIVSAMVVEARE